MWLKEIERLKEKYVSTCHFHAFVSSCGSAVVFLWPEELTLVSLLRQVCWPWTLLVFFYLKKKKIIFAGCRILVSLFSPVGKPVSFCAISYFAFQHIFLVFQYFEYFMSRWGFIFVFAFVLIEFHCFSGSVGWFPSSMWKNYHHSPLKYFFCPVHASPSGSVIRPMSSGIGLQSLGSQSCSYYHGLPIMTLMMRSFFVLWIICNALSSKFINFLQIVLISPVNFLIFSQMWFTAPTLS